MAVGMAGVEMIHRYPVERGVQVLLHLRHQSPDHRFQLIIFGAILRRDNEAELVAVAIGPLQESLAVDLISIRTIERSEEHTSELQSLMRSSYAVFCLQKQ